jgi:hypothetical protein
MTVPPESTRGSSSPRSQSGKRDPLTTREELLGAGGVLGPAYPLIL